MRYRNVLHKVVLSNGKYMLVAKQNYDERFTTSSNIKNPIFMHSYNVICRRNCFVVSSNNNIFTTNLCCTYYDFFFFVKT